MEGIGYCDLWKGPVEKSSPLGDSFLEWHQTFLVNQLPQVTCNKDLRQGPFGAPSRTFLTETVSGGGFPWCLGCNFFGSQAFQEYLSIISGLQMPSHLYLLFITFITAIRGESQRMNHDFCSLFISCFCRTGWGFDQPAISICRYSKAMPAMPMDLGWIHGSTISKATILGRRLCSSKTHTKRVALMSPPVLRGGNGRHFSSVSRGFRKDVKGQHLEQGEL